jgi:hypothetical protein
MIPHVNSVCKSCFYYLTLISRLRKFLDRESTKTLVHALVITRLDYANSLLYGLPQSALDKLQRVQNVAVRLIYDVGKRDHISALRRDLHWLTVVKRLDFKIALQTFRCLNRLAPVYLSRLVHPHVPPRNLRVRPSLVGTLIPPPVKNIRLGGAPSPVRLPRCGTNFQSN